jgi:hypothetical protein
MKRIICTFAFFSLVMTACKKEENNTTNNNNSGGVDCSTVTYSGTIASLANSKCNTAGCHAAGSVSGDYTTYAGLKAKFDNGSLKQRVIVEKTMPQGTTLSETELKQFECWINAGAPNN